ncbi:hypothetical protein AAG906_020012 [Vitis piasezkii]
MVESIEYRKFVESRAVTGKGGIRSVLRKTLWAVWENVESGAVRKAVRTDGIMVEFVLLDPGGLEKVHSVRCRKSKSSVENRESVWCRKIVASRAVAAKVESGASLENRVGTNLKNGEISVVRNYWIGLGKRGLESAGGLGKGGIGAVRKTVRTSAKNARMSVSTGKIDESGESGRWNQCEKSLGPRRKIAEIGCGQKIVESGESGTKLEPVDYLKTVRTSAVKL